MSSLSSLVGVRNQMCAAHPARPGERGIEHGDRDVARADEVDLLLAGLRRVQAERQLAELAGHDEHRVEERVDAVGRPLPHQRRLVDAVHHHEQLVQCHAAHPAHSEARVEAADPVSGLLDERGVAAPAVFGASGEEPLPPRPGLDHEIA